MILILSEQDDLSTSFILFWLSYLNANDVIRINIEELSNFVSIDNEGNFVVESPTALILYKNIKAIWVRRGKIRLNAFNSINHLGGRFDRHIDNEHSGIDSYLSYCIDKHATIGSLKNMRVNKLIIADYAKHIGLNIPETIVTTKKIELIKFAHRFDNIITKGINETYWFDYENHSIKGFTYLVEKNDINLFPDTFFPSLFQELIEKKYELRVFYLKGKCYTMAIFSQNDSNTKVDFRHYNFETPNRSVPFNLPTNIASQIDKLMKFIGLDCGSIDILVNLQDVYYFLEVNPVGQFGMTSVPCNYYLEKEIANILNSAT